MTKAFRVSGSYKALHHNQTFNIELVAENKDRAKELILTRIGSKHKVPRRLIKIKDAIEVPEGQIANAAVRHQAELRKK